MTTVRTEHPRTEDVWRDFPKALSVWLQVPDQLPRQKYALYITGFAMSLGTLAGAVYTLANANPRIELRKFSFMNWIAVTKIGIVMFAFACTNFYNGLRHRNRVPVLCLISFITLLVITVDCILWAFYTERESLERDAGVTVVNKAVEFITIYLLGLFVLIEGSVHYSLRRVLQGSVNGNPNQNV